MGLSRNESLRRMPRYLWRDYLSARAAVSISYAVLRIFDANARIASGHWSFEMAHTLGHGEAPIGYRSGRTPGRSAGLHSRSALRRVSFYLRSTIEAIANAKLRRMERELELRGIRPVRLGDD
jgi:hypothetical protein